MESTKRFVSQLVRFSFALILIATAAGCGPDSGEGGGANIAAAPAPPPPPPPGSCQPSSSLSVLVTGKNVVSYVPKGNWDARSTIAGVSLINIEGSSITPGVIPTANAVNS